MDNFFRKEVMEGRLSHIGLPVRVTTRWMHFFTAFFLLFIAFIIFLIVTGSYSRKAAVQGFLLPDKGVIKVISPREGQITEIHVQEGQHVKEGELLFVVNVGTESIGGNTIDAIYENLRNRQSLVKTEMQLLREIEVADAAQLAQRIELKEQEVIFSEQESIATVENVALLEGIVDRYKALSAKNLTPIGPQEEAEKELITARIEAITLGRNLATLKSEIQQLKTEQSVLDKRQANLRSNLQREFSSLGQQIAELDDQRAIRIRAPETGIVTRLTSAIGTIVNIDLVLLSLVPDGATLEALLYIPSKDAGFVNVGTEILIRYDAYPYQKFGLYKAYVKTISQAAVTGSELPFSIDAAQNEPVYVVTAKLETPYIMTSGVKRPLQIGTKFQADLVLEQRKVWEWLLGPLRQLKAST
jgi:membrane fusion protein